MTVLRIGSRGEDVKTLQRILNLADDGIFGPVTDEAVRAFQAEHGLGIDGVVGTQTWAALKEVKPSAAPSASDELSGVNIKKSRRKINLIVVHCTATEEGKD